jgi:hypothetical protein
MYNDLIIDALLTFGFGVQHSIIALIGVKRFIQKHLGLDSMQWRAIQTVINVNYILIAAALWRSSDIVIYELTGTAMIIMCIFLVIGWLWYFESHLLEYDCGQAFGCSAILAKIFKLEKPVPEMWKVIGRRWIRFPVHTAFFPMFLCFPTMTADLLVFGIVANIGNIYGTVLYDRRLVKLIGEPYKKYIQRTNLISPFMFGKKRKGAYDMDLPKPIMYKNPEIYIDGLIIGLIIGFLHFHFRGIDVYNNFESLYSLALFSFVTALVGGLVSGFTSMSRFKKYLMENDIKSFLTLLGTKSAIISFTNLLLYFTLSFMVYSDIPSFAIILPVWLIVLWVTNFVSASFIIMVSAQEVKSKVTMSSK